ncbi:MAG: CRTAC1 family protein [Acidobacteriota bacterium]|nr:MAG: CRTAC1 family protein [Acidobacteriota bacterium]
MKGNRTLTLSLTFLLLMGFHAGTSLGAEGGLPAFTDVTAEAGINFKHSFGDMDLTNIVEGTGSGATVFDYNNDGYVDFYFPNGAWLRAVNDNRGRRLRDKLQNQLFRNNGDGTFTDVTADAGVGDKSPSFGASTADFDSDGDQDIYVLNYGPNVLYRNNGDGTFTDISAASGLADPSWSLSAPWIDYDNDGDLDVFVANYLQYDDGKFRAYYAAAGYPGPLSYASQDDKLYRNNGDGTFTDVSREAGITGLNGRAMSATAADLNDDGFIDIYVANDATENFYYENTGKGTFVEKGLFLGLAFGEHGQGVSSMGPYAGDIDRNGRLDVYVPDMGYSSVLMNQGEYFEDQTTRSKVALACGQYTGWGGLLFDFDNDGFLDLFVSNGNAHHEYTEEDVLLHNDRTGVYVDVSRQSGAYFEEKHVGRGSSFADYDNDGDLDLIVVNLNDSAKLLRNDGGTRNNWIIVVPSLSSPDRYADGARVTVTAGSLKQVQDAVPVRGYLSQVDPRLHFGLGSASQIDSIEIRWPGNVVERLENVPVNQILKVTRKAR